MILFPTFLMDSRRYMRHDTRSAMSLCQFTRFPDKITMDHKTCLEQYWVVIATVPWYAIQSLGAGKYVSLIKEQRPERGVALMGEC